MSEPSSPEAAAEALARLYTDSPNHVAIRLTAAAIRERDRLIRAEERERCARLIEQSSVLWDHRLIQKVAETIRKSEERTSARKGELGG